MIKVYCLELDTTKKTEFSTLMSMKYKDTMANKLSNYAWYALEQILLKELGIVINKDMICYNENNKPYILNNDVYFNISHTDEYVLIGISDSEIGVDIESKIDIERANHIIKKFDNAVLREYNESDDKEAYFSSLWVLLEAKAKMLGIGLSFEFIKSFDLNDKLSVLYFYDKKRQKVYYYTAINKENEGIGGVSYVL